MCGAAVTEQKKRRQVPLLTDKGKGVTGDRTKWNYWMGKWGNNGKQRDSEMYKGRVARGE